VSAPGSSPRCPKPSPSSPGRHAAAPEALLPGGWRDAAALLGRGEPARWVAVLRPAERRKAGFRQRAVTGLTGRPREQSWEAVESRASPGVGCSEGTHGIAEESRDSRTPTNKQEREEGGEDSWVKFN